MKKLSTTNANLPMPVTVIGTLNNNKVNFATAGWVSRVNGQPPMLGVSLNRSHLTSKSIKRNKVFSLSLLSPEYIQKVDHCGIVSGNDCDKSGVFEYFTDTFEQSPLIKCASLTTDCKLVEIVKLPTHEFFIGEICAVWAKEECLRGNDSLDFKKLDPILLSMPDNNYWQIGENLAKAWSTQNRSLKESK